MGEVPGLIKRERCGCQRAGSARGRVCPPRLGQNRPHGWLRVMTWGATEAWGVYLFVLI